MCQLLILSLSALSLVLQGVDVGADLERRPQLDVHAGHQVVLSEQQQRLAVDLLQPEGLGHVAAAWRHRQVLQRLNHFSGITAKERLMVRRPHRHLVVGCNIYGNICC